MALESWEELTGCDGSALQPEIDTGVKSGGVGDSVGKRIWLSLLVVTVGADVEADISSR